MIWLISRRASSSSFSFARRCSTARSSASALSSALLLNRIFIRSRNLLRASSSPRWVTNNLLNSSNSIHLHQPCCAYGLTWPLTHCHFRRIPGVALMWRCAPGCCLDFCFSPVIKCKMTRMPYSESPTGVKAGFAPNKQLIPLQFCSFTFLSIE